MGAQPAKVHSSLEMLRGTPIEVWNKTESRWVKAVVGSPKDVRESPPNPTAVLVLYQERINGRTDGYKWIRQEDIPQLLRARPEMAKEAGMMQSVMDTFGTMFDNPSSFEARPTKGGQPAISHPMYSAASHGSIPFERPQAQPQQDMMSTFMASVGLAPAASNPMMPSASFASTVDQNSALQQNNFARVGSMASTIPEDQAVGFMDSIMGSMAMMRPGQNYDAAAHAPPTMHNNIGGPMQSFRMPNETYCQAPEHNAGGVMASLMGMGMVGSRAGSHVGSYAPSMVLEENRSPNRTPMSSMMGSVKGSACENMNPYAVAANAHAPNPMSSFMGSFILPQSAAQMHAGR